MSPPPDGSERATAPNTLELGLVCLNGFTRGVGPGTGLYRLYKTLCRTWYDRRRQLILHRTWRSKPAETADLLVAHEPRELAAIAYSYGAGWALTQLAEQLDRRGRTLDAVFLIDPVTRYRLTKWRSMIRGQIYQIPKSVARVWSWRQVNKTHLTDPVGQAVHGSAGTIVEPQIVIGSPVNLQAHAAEVPEKLRVKAYQVSHGSIDGFLLIHETIIDTIAQNYPPPNGKRSP